MYYVCNFALNESFIEDIDAEECNEKGFLEVASRCKMQACYVAY